MLETYFQEIRRKRTEKRIFWAFVLLSTMILYFFFQGKYLAININLTSLLSFSGQVDSGSGQNYFEFRSFGVINVKTMPRTARISINGQNHTSGEQILTPYGNYHLHVTHPGYLTGSIYFRIDTSQDYYISDIHLLPIPQYRHHQSWSSGTYVTPIGEKSWIVT